MAERYATRPSTFLNLDSPHERHLALSADYTVWSTGVMARKEAHDKAIAEAGGMPKPRTAEEIEKAGAEQAAAFDEMSMKLRGGADAAGS